MSKKSARESTTDPASSGEVATASETLSFEQAIERLSEIVEDLERGDLLLEDSLKLFEEGVKLARTSQARLDNAEKRVEELLGVDEAGKVITRELDPE